MNISRLRQDKIKQLISAGIEPSEAQAEIDLLIEHFLGLEKKDVFLHSDIDITKQKLENFYKAIETRVKERMPVQYIIGYTYFYGLKFIVNGNVLIPRQDTELLVNVISENINKTSPIIADIGVGSGNISISLLKNNKELSVIATDISEEAIKVAEQNAVFHQVQGRITIYLTNLLDNIDIEFDAVVSNPPYIDINKSSTLAKEVSDYEPHTALFVSSDNPIDIYEKIFTQADQKLKAGGFLAVEISPEYAKELKELLCNQLWEDIKIHKDLNGLDRVISANKCR